MKTIMHISTVLLLIMGLFGCGPSNKGNEVTSPDKQLAIGFHLNDGKPFYHVTYRKDTVIYPSQLGMVFKEIPSLSDGFKVINTEVAEYNSSWEQAWGENKTLQDHYQELLVQMQEVAGQKRLMNLYFRAYNDGVAFRYEIPEQNNIGNFIIMDELTQFDVSGNPDTWWIWADYNTYEKLYQQTSMDEATWVATPVTMRGDKNVHISIHEAALTDYAGMTLKQKETGVYEAELVPWANGDKVRTSAPMKTP
ncbi:MAG: glycoside hydrolase family 97 N-terminal domain-containing protein, partial [Bacteroidales bacterium]|nr:glycoside hydrolase family 97 N-terminal domain-containing protein [Bacteroidales bacterium]